MQIDELPAGEQNQCPNMDMNRVASITLLKDATAKALYGSKGANGVVVIRCATM